MFSRNSILHAQKQNLFRLKAYKDSQFGKKDILQCACCGAPYNYQLTIFFFLMNFGQLFDIFMIMFWQLSFQLANQNVSRSERERQIRTPPLLGLQFWLLDYYSIDSSGQILKRTRCLVSHTARWHQTVVRSSCVSTPPSSIVVFTMVLACRPGSLLPCSISQMTTRLAECFGWL